jgi:hypothetical protein
MNRLAIVTAAVIIFMTAWSTALSQVELNVKYAETNNQTQDKTKTENKKTVIDTLSATQSVEALANDKTPAEATKAPETAPKPPEIVCGPHDPATIYNILREINVPRDSAIQLLGSWKHESGGAFDQCQKRGDGGIAWGLNSWHPGRRQDMPQGLREQVIWAVTVEMPRDCRSCYDTIMAGGSTYKIRNAIQKSTRWGILGNRWLYADQFNAQFK